MSKEKWERPKTKTSIMRACCRLPAPDKELSTEGGVAFFFRSFSLPLFEVEMSPFPRLFHRPHFDI